MAKYLGHGKMVPAAIEDDMVDSRWKTWSIGCDVHLRTVFVAVLIPDYTRGKIQRFVVKYTTDYQSLQAMRQWLLTFKHQYGDTEFVIESTSTYHRPVVHALQREFAAIVINPTLAGQAKKKADKYDATLLAYHGLTGIWDVSFVPSGIQHDLTNVSRRFMKANREMTKATNAIGTLLLDANLLLPREIQMKSVSARSIVQAIAQGETDPVKAVNHAVYYALHRDMPDRQAVYQRLIEALTALPDVSVSVRHVLAALLKDYAHFERQCLIYHAWMNDLLKKLSVTYPDGRRLSGVDCVELLTSMPGVGTRYGEVFLAEAGIEAVTRFGTAEALEAFAGFDPSKTYSADKVMSGGRRKGNVDLHAVTIQIAQGLLQHAKRDNPLARWGRNYKMRMGNTIDAHKQAVTAVGKRVIRTSFHILRTGKPYDGSRYHVGAHQTNMLKQLKLVVHRVHDLANDMHVSELDDTARAVVTEAIHAFRTLSGIEGGFTLCPTTTDESIDRLGFSKRTCHLLQKGGIHTLSMLWFRLIQGTLRDVERFGEKSYEEVVSVLVQSGRILKNNDSTSS
jgi:transposase